MAYFYVYETKPLVISFDPSNVLQDYKHIIVSIEQSGIIINKTEEDMDIDTETGKITLNLSQEETGRFHKGEALVQVNIYYEFEERDVSKQGKIEIRDNLYKKVINNE